MSGGLKASDYQLGGLKACGYQFGGLKASGYRLPPSFSPLP
jgi:hypothetical protein